MKSELARGEHKSLQTDRVILMPGPDDEVRTVNLIYQWFIDHSISTSEIAGRLNGMKVKTDLGREWTRATVQEILTNEKYIGNNVYNRISFKLKKTRVANPREMWIKKEAAFEPIVQPDLFYTAQGIIRERNRRYTDQELIERLRALYENRGLLSGLIIDETENMAVGQNTSITRINEKLASFAEWNAPAIDKRHGLLIALAQDVWKTTPIDI